MLGLFLGSAIAVGVAWIFRRSTPRRVKGVFRKGQLLSASFYSLGHGGNDAQKTMGIIALLLYSHGYRFEGYAPVPDPGWWDALMNYFGSHLRNEFIPLWVVLSCHAAMGLGTLSGGWRIVKTMGTRLVKLRPVDGFCAELGAAATLVLTIFWKVPVSTTHTITGSIVGVGSVHRVTAVRWGVAGRILWAWVLTIPGAAVIAAVSYWIAASL
jgi:PiT family inorganic phosphate transporter